MLEEGILYSSLDKIFTEIMKEGIANPDFRDLRKTNDYKNSLNDRLLAYDSYAAIMVINLAATIHDRYKKIPDTWSKLISHEIKLHKSLLDDNHIILKRIHRFH